MTRIKMEGYLKKRRTTKWPHVWQQRWVSLNGNTLSWSKAKSGLILGTLVMNNIEWIQGTKEAPTELRFKAYQANKRRFREFIFRAESASECGKWKEKLLSVNKYPTVETLVETKELKVPVSEEPSWVCAISQEYAAAAKDPITLSSSPLPLWLPMRIENLSVEVEERGPAWVDVQLEEGEFAKTARIGDTLLLRLQTSDPVDRAIVRLGGGEVLTAVGEDTTWTSRWELSSESWQEEGPLVFRVICSTKAGESLESSMPVCDGRFCADENITCDMREWSTPCALDLEPISPQSFKVESMADAFEISGKCDEDFMKPETRKEHPVSIFASLVLSAAKPETEQAISHQPTSPCKALISKEPVQAPKQNKLEEIMSPTPFDQATPNQLSHPLNCPSEISPNDSRITFQYNPSQLFSPGQDSENSDWITPSKPEPCPNAVHPLKKDIPIGETSPDETQYELSSSTQASPFSSLPRPIPQRMIEKLVPGLTLEKADVMSSYKKVLEWETGSVESFSFSTGEEEGHRFSPAKFKQLVEKKERSRPMYQEHNTKMEKLRENCSRTIRSHSEYMDANSFLESIERSSF